MPKNIAFCGLDCGACPAFIATKNNNDELRQKTAAEWTARHQAKGSQEPPIQPREINCRGCLSKGPLYAHCRECAVRICGLGRGFKNCEDCPEYRCAKLTELQSHLF